MGSRPPRPWIAVVLLPAGLLVLAVVAGVLGLAFLLGVRPSTGATTVATTAATRQATATPGDPTPLPGSRAETVHPGLAPDAGNPDTTPGAALVSGRLYLTTWGSSVCPQVAVSLTVEGRHRVSVALSPAGGPTCTADLAPRTVSLALDPAAVDVSVPLTVRLTGPGIDPRDPTRTAPVEVLATPVA